MINFQKRQKKVLFFVTKNNLKLAKTWKIYVSVSLIPYYYYYYCYYYYYYYCKSLYDSQTQISLLITWLTIKRDSLKTFWCALGMLLRTTHQKYSSYSLFLIRTRAAHFVFVVCRVWGERDKSLMSNTITLDWVVFPSKTLSRRHTKDC